MEVITNLLCLGAVFISVPVVNSADDHTWHLVAHFCQELWMIAFTMSWLSDQAHQLEVIESKSLACFILARISLPSKHRFVLLTIHKTYK